MNLFDESKVTTHVVFRFNVHDISLNSDDPWAKLQLTKKHFRDLVKNFVRVDYNEEKGYSFLFIEDDIRSTNRAVKLSLPQFCNLIQVDNTTNRIINNTKLHLYMPVCRINESSFTLNVAANETYSDENYLDHVSDILNDSELSIAKDEVFDSSKPSLFFCSEKEINWDAVKENYSVKLTDALIKKTEPYKPKSFMEKITAYLTNF